MGLLNDHVRLPRNLLVPVFARRRHWMKCDSSELSIEKPASLETGEVGFHACFRD